MCFYAYSPHFVSAHFSLTLVGECGRVLVLSVTCFQRVYWGAAGVIVQLVKHLVKQKVNRHLTQCNICYYIHMFECNFQLFMCFVSFLASMSLTCFNKVYKFYKHCGYFDPYGPTYPQFHIAHCNTLQVEINE